MANNNNNNDLTMDKDDGEDQEIQDVPEIELIIKVSKFKLSKIR